MAELYDYLCNYMCEPTTAITDILLSVFSFWCYWSIATVKKNNPSMSAWSLFFLFLSLATFMGGIAHGISCLQNHSYYMICWLTMQILSGISIFFVQQAVFISEIRNIKIKNNFIIASKIQLAIFFVCVFVFLNFRVLAINSAIGLIQLLVLCFPINNRKYKGMVSLGFWISFFTIYINQKKINLTNWFNHNDISHVVMFVSMLLIFKGVNSMKHYKEYNVKE